MNGRTLTDAQITSALRAHLPESAYPGLRERILDAVETTTQQRLLPSFLGALTTADPIARRRNLLIAAALLVALAMVSASAIGALRLLQRDPVKDLSVAPTAETPSAMPKTIPLFSPYMQAGTALEPGTYRLRGQGTEAMVAALPAGWFANSYDRNSGVYRGMDDQVAWLSISSVDTLPASPCSAGGSRGAVREPPIGPTVDDLVRALGTLPILDISGPADITVDGFQGKQIDLTHPGGVVGCEYFELWLTPPVLRSVDGAGLPASRGSGESWYVSLRENWHATLEILDVDGLRWVIIPSYRLDAGGEVKRELGQIVDSIKIER